MGKGNREGIGEGDSNEGQQGAVERATEMGDRVTAADAVTGKCDGDSDGVGKGHGQWQQQADSGRQQRERGNGDSEGEATG